MIILRMDFIGGRECLWTYAHMGHSTGPGIARDYEKSNLAMLAGWRTFVFDRRMVEAGTALDVTAKALGIG